ncbi:hypothetical protein [Streptomyces sp. NPDC008150]|uniref:hypothetical protein n=1 Tax=Streptomyces sp. NPDC008150 TaxID=3364816 RepID=UPI0036DFDF96
MTTTATGAQPLLCDPFEVHPDLAPLRQAAFAGDWTAVRAFFDGLDGERTHYAAGALGDLDEVETLLERAAAEQPDDPLPRALLAERYIRMGWEIRSRAEAQHVSRDRFARFHEWLRKAERLLIEVCAEHPGYAAAWASRQTSARGLELGQSESRRRYDRLSAVHPHHYGAQLQHLQQVCPKWSGSWEAAHGFARECATAAPPGSPSGALVALAHIEHWVSLEGGQDVAYLREVAVLAELRQAARDSVLHPDFVPGWHAPGAHGAFAMVFSLAGRPADAAPHFEALGNRIDEFPWRYLPRWQGAFADQRDAALATARGGHR